jgi:hypothetical protein
MKGMDTMRRLLLLLPTLGLVALSAGCNHTAGICDCEIPGHHCAYCDCNYSHSAVAPPVGLGVSGPVTAPTAMPSAPAEQLQTLPKPVEK